MSSKPILLKEGSSISMDSINIQIEPGKTYFSDGYVEVARADETDLLREEELKTVTDNPSNWPSWFLKQSTLIGSTALNTVDYLGESLANFFGITTPKYQFEINYHNNIIQEMRAEKIENEENMKGWTQQTQQSIVTAEPC